MARHRERIVYVVAWLIALAGTLRYLDYILGHPSRWLILGLLATFFVVLATGPWIFRRPHKYMHIYLAALTCILVALTIVTTIEDFAAIPFMSLILLAMTRFPPQIGFRWIAIFCVIMVVCMIAYGITYHGMNARMIMLTAFLYLVIFLFFGAFMAVFRQLETARTEAETAREKSDALLAELQVAHQQLQAYTGQAEELAVIAERNRWARELHDSVTQSLYSLTLLAEAGQRMIQVGDVPQIAGNQTRLGEIAQQALQEMRLLVYELRPLALESEGLVGALEQRLETVERRAGIKARVLVEGEIQLAPDLEEELYGIAQEALNNALKHAKASEVVLSVRVTEGSVALEVADDGQAFDLPDVRDKGGLGLISMRERADKIGGQLEIDSAPGAGTRVRISVQLDSSSR
jgi:signal transduction histidine kinase